MFGWFCRHSLYFCVVGDVCVGRGDGGGDGDGDGDGGGVGLSWWELGSIFLRWILIFWGLFMEF